MASTARPVLAGRVFERLPALEQLTQVVVRRRMKWVDGDRLPVRLFGDVPLLLLREQDAVIVVRVSEAETERHGGAIVLLGLRPILLAAVKADQIGMRLGEIRISCEGRLVRGDRAVQVSGSGQRETALQTRGRVILQAVHGGKERIVETRPARTVLDVPLQRPAGVLRPPCRAVGLRQRVCAAPHSGNNAIARSKC